MSYITRTTTIAGCKNTVAWASLGAVAATGTLRGIDSSEEPVDRHSLMLTGAHTLGAADAATVALFHGHRAAVDVGAGHPHEILPFGSIEEGGKGAWTRLDTLAAAGALVPVDFGESTFLREGHGAEGACLHAVAQAETSVNAVGLALIEGVLYGA